MTINSDLENITITYHKTKKKPSKNKNKIKIATLSDYNETTEIAKIISEASIIVQKRLNVTKDVSDRIATLVIFASKKYNQDPRHMLAIIKVESDFNQSAHNSYSCKYKREKDKSRCGDHSIAQINYHIWKNEFIENGKKPLDYHKLKSDDSYAIFRMAEILSILKKKHGKEYGWYARYHSSDSKLKNSYLKKVNDELKKISEINPDYIFKKIGSL